MLNEVRDYLIQIKSHLRLDPNTEGQIIRELYTHFQEKVVEKQGEGLGEEEASKKAIDSFGQTRSIARLMYEAYSKGSWTDALMACLPHLLVAILFFLHLWQHYVLAPMVFTLIVSVTLYGWWRGKPNWLYSWIGYSLFPLLLVGYFSRSVPAQAIGSLFGGSGMIPNLWLLILVLGSYLLFAWIVIRTTIRVVRRDWILASLMLAPLPIFGCWLFNIEQTGSVFYANNPVINQWDGIIAFSLLVLGISSSVFLRLRQRIMKFGALVMLSSIAFTIVAYNIWGNPGFLGLIAFALFMLLFLYIPALLEVGIGHGEKESDRRLQDNLTDYPKVTL